MGGGGGRGIHQCQVNGDVNPNKVQFSSLNSKTGCLFWPRTPGLGTW